MPNRDYVVEAAEAHTNLNTWHSVIALLEGGSLYGGRHGAAERVISIAKSEAAKELKLFDKARNTVKPNAMLSGADKRPLELKLGKGE